MRRALLAATVLICTLSFAAVARADDSWYAGDADFTQAFIDSSDGVKLHADILRPKGVPAGTPVPVIMSVGPYFNHSGQVGPAGPVEDANYDPIGASGHPEASERFKDFVVDTGLFKKGYAFVMVDLRGFGGSSGCLDWVGPGEQADVKNAVEWAAAQPWSNGKVGMYGKSYDGVTGLIGVAQQPKGLAAVVSQEPVYDLYRYLYTNKVRYENSLATPALYDAIAATPGQATDATTGPDYLANSVNDPKCLSDNYLSQAGNDDHSSDFWKQRDLIAETKGKSTPLFLTQGFLENNTKPDGAWDLYNGLTGPKRAWFGMWDHIRGNETAEGTDIETPSAPAPHHWFDEVMSFYDQYLKGQAPSTTYPPVEIQDNTGAWRAATSFPEADATSYTTALNTGDYDDSNSNAGSNDGFALNQGGTVGAGLWTFSPPLTSAAHLSGIPAVKVTADSSAANGTMSVDVYDVDAAGKATILSRTAQLLAQGTNTVEPEMYGNDWVIPAGHRIGVLVTSANAEWWTASTPSGGTVTVKSASITLPFLKYTRPDTFTSKIADRLPEFLKDAPIDVDAATVTKGVRADFAVPPAAVAAPADAGGQGSTASSSQATTTSSSGTTSAAATPATATTVTASGSGSSSKLAPGAIRLTGVRWHRHGLSVRGRAPAGTRILLRASRHGKVISRRTVVVGSSGRFAALLKVRRRAGTSVAPRGGASVAAPRH